MCMRCFFKGMARSLLDANGFSTQRSDGEDALFGAFACMYCCSQPYGKTDRAVPFNIECLPWLAPAGVIWSDC